MPWDNGPAFMGHLSRIAKISSVEVRKTAMQPWPSLSTTREPSTGNTPTAQIFFQWFAVEPQTFDFEFALEDAAGFVFKISAHGSL